MTRAAGIALLGMLAAGCGSDIGLAKEARCDGVLQPQEDTVDQPFDMDEDGFFDASNPDCASTYGAAFLDCDDGDSTINPHEEELPCDGVDNDCSVDSPDGADLDLDGYTVCDDCADSVAAVNPGAVELTCNDLDDDCDAETLDGQDADADGASECVDCNDSDATVGPGATETPCNRIDDDCNPDTVDGEDGDLDGWSVCEDCNDVNPDAFPLGTEVCDNAIDDDCNGDIDEGCVSDYSDTWDLDANVSYSCIWGLINIDFDSVLVDDATPNITINSLGGSQPGEMTGTFSSSTDFSTELVVPGSCRETYTFEGVFTSMNSFEASFTAAFTGSSSACFDCTSQSWTVTGSR